MSGERRYLLHGVARTDPPPLPDALGAGEVVCVEAAGLYALLTVTDEAGLLEARLADPQGAEDLAVGHDRLLREASAAADVIPVRLGAVLSGEDAVRDALVRGATAFAAGLDRIAGCEEYAVEIRRRPGAPPPAAAAPEAVAPDAARAPASGRAYLTARGRKASARRTQRGAADAFAATLEDRLLTAMPAVARAELKGDAGARDASCLRRWNVLCPRGRTAPLEAVLERADADAAPLGLAVRATGPWPAYSFAEAA